MREGDTGDTGCVYAVAIGGGPIEAGGSAVVGSLSGDKSFLVAVALDAALFGKSLEAFSLPRILRFQKDIRV
jgi:hypothetical protein